MEKPAAKTGPGGLAQVWQVLRDVAPLPDQVLPKDSASLYVDSAARDPNDPEDLSTSPM
jgi:hypothetical protein